MNFARVGLVPLKIAHGLNPSHTGGRPPLHALDKGVIPAPFQVQLQSMEDFMSAETTVLTTRREIVKGPGAKDWMLGMAVEGRTVDLTVRGHTSMCESLVSG